MTANVRPTYQRFIVFCLLWALAAPICANAVEIADTPLEIHINEAPPALMFILDDSGSMDSELMTPEPNGRVGDRYYLFPDEAYFPEVDHTFGVGNALDVDQRRIWRTQWCAYNPLYFDPHKVYHPWPGTAAHPFEDADLQHPLSDPHNSRSGSVRCRMAEVFFSILDAGAESITIPVAHYFTTLATEPSGTQTIYLVAWQDRDEDGLIDLGLGSGVDSRRYYRLQDDGDGSIEDNELIPIADGALIASLRPGIYSDGGRFIRHQTDTEALQNFVNWFGFHRKREFVLKNVVAGILKDLKHTQVGFYAINSGPRVPMQPINIPARVTGNLESAATILDRSEFLLDTLYAMRSRGSTPLRTALDQVGRYFHQGRTSVLGESPFWSEATGGGCQRAYAVVVTDGYWNDDFSGLGNVDGDQGAPYADSWSDTLADIAMYYYVTDLASALPDTLSGKGCDIAPHQHLTTHTLSLGIGGTIDPDDIDADGRPDRPGYLDDPCFKDGRTPRPVWPMPIGDSPASIDDLWHAAINGRGLYFNTQQPDDLAEALTGIVSEFDTMDYSASALEVKGPVLQDEAMIYQAFYRAGHWTGDLKAFRYDTSANAWEPGVGDLAWSAAERLGVPTLTADSRRIVTYGGIWRAAQGVAFRYDELSAGQQSALGSDLVSDSSRDKTARMLVDYLRGREVPSFRSRKSRLGDIVHSTPVLVDDTVFVGANDGMLHAFDARSGEERFGFIPGLVFGQLKHLSQNNYDARHRFYVDATPSMGEVIVGEHQRRRYLVGGLGKGGKGYYCLLIGKESRARIGDEYGSYESVFSVDDFRSGTLENDIAEIVRWEYPQPDTAADEMDNDGDGRVDEAGEQDPDMGYSFGQGYAVNANTGEGEFRPVVIFANGYNSPRGKAVLFIVDADKGTLVRKIDTGVGEDNGLSIPAIIDVDLDRCVDYVYAGDLRGNLWKFDLTSESVSRWGVAYGRDVDGNGRIDAGDGDLPQPLFQTRGQPIIGRPDIMRARSICAADAPGYMVMFGTGRYLGFADLQDTSQQSIYALWDYGDDSDDTEFLGYISDRANGSLSNGLRLVPRHVVSRSSMDGSLVRVLNNTAVDFSVGDDIEDGDGMGSNNIGTPAPDPLKEAGWFFDFPAAPDPDADPGERVIANVVIRGGQALITSFAPDTAPCTSGGVSWIYLLSGCTGDAPDTELNTEPGLRPYMTPMTAKRYPVRLNINPAVVKTVSELPLDQLILSDDMGRIIKEAFIGERWGRVYWRENVD